MKYYVISKRVVHVGEVEETNHVIAIVNKEKIAKDFCSKYPNAEYKEEVVGLNNE